MYIGMIKCVHQRYRGIRENGRSLGFGISDSGVPPEDHKSFRFSRAEFYNGLLEHDRLVTSCWGVALHCPRRKSTAT